MYLPIHCNFLKVKIIEHFRIPNPSFASENLLDNSL